jgi:glycerate 2-kinase
MDRNHSPKTNHATHAHARAPRALIACDKFKGSLSAADACAAVQRGLGEGWQVDLCPIADGGEGFVDTMIAAMQGVKVTAPSHDALGREISAEYGIVPREGKTIAVIEMAAASGMWRIDSFERDVMRSSTFGTGELMRHAIEQHHVDQIIVGLGGSATNDGGAGMAAALGVRFFDAAGNLVEATPIGLQKLARVDVSQRMPLPPVLAACDVDNPLCGARGASAIYGPQKGASPAQVAVLDDFLQNLAALCAAQDHAIFPGAGAAGGLGFGLMAFANGVLQSGFTMVADICALHARVAAADLVITGEGSLDAQSLSGKGPVGIARIARERGVPCVAVAGVCTEELRASGVFADAIDLVSLGHPLDFTLEHAASLLEQSVATVSARWAPIANFYRAPQKF